jgi:hypothetical protein
MTDTLWIGNLITALATISASSIAFIAAISINKNSLKNEQNKFEKQLDWEKEKLNQQMESEEISKVYGIYNKVLKADGETLILSHYPVEFYSKNYHEKVRPILFESYHLLDIDVREIVKKIDSIVAMSEFQTEDV